VSVALRGNLEDFGISEVFQLIGQQRKTGVLEVSSEERRIHVVFDAGHVVCASPVQEQADGALAELLVRQGRIQPDALERARAESETSLVRLGHHLLEQGLLAREELDASEAFLTRETIFDLLRQSRGSFHFSARPVTHRHDPASLLGAEQILMDGLRMVDEWRAIARRLPPEDAVLRRRRSFEAYVAQASGDAAQRSVSAERVYLLVDGRLTLRRVIDLSHLGTFEASRILADLLAAGVIAPETRATRTPARQRAGGRPGLSLAAGAGVLALLAATTIALALGAARPSPQPGVLRLDPLQDVQARFARQKLRNTLEAWVAARGGWPPSLEPLVESGWADAASLTGPGAGQYYYRHGADGAVLLAPEQTPGAAGSAGAAAAGTDGAKDSETDSETDNETDIGTDGATG